ncbi:hypothetical protein KEM52_000780 [Ascosphaera acerosa]|nr:hypothetical protein KEM52_000780 [Ascosphaera acerosa]
MDSRSFVRSFAALLQTHQPVIHDFNQSRNRHQLPHLGPTQSNIMTSTHDEIYQQKMTHWQESKGRYEPVHIHIHHDPKAGHAAGQGIGALPAPQLLKTMLSPVSGLLGGLQSLKVPGHQYIPTVGGSANASGKDSLVTPPMSPSVSSSSSSAATLVPTMPAQSPSPPHSPMAERELRHLGILLPAEPQPTPTPPMPMPTPTRRPTTPDETVVDVLAERSARAAASSSRARARAPHAPSPSAASDDASYGFTLSTPPLLAKSPLLASLFASVATFSGPPLFIYSLFTSGTLVFALSLALPLCIVGALCFTVVSAAVFGLTIILPSTVVASVAAVATWAVEWCKYYLVGSPARSKPRSARSVELRFRS